MVRSAAKPAPSPWTLIVSSPVLPALIVSELVGFAKVTNSAAVEVTVVVPAPPLWTVIVSLAGL